MKKLLLLFTLLLMISAESFAQRSYSRSSYSSSRSSYSRPSYSKATYTKPSYVKAKSTKSTYIKVTATKPIYKKSVAATKIDGTKTIIKPIINPINKPINKTINKPNITKNTSINNKQAYSGRYNDQNKTYIYRDNSISWSNLALMYYVVNYNNNTHRYDTIKAPNKQQLEKKVDTWTTNQ